MRQHTGSFMVWCIMKVVRSHQDVIFCLCSSASLRLTQRQQGHNPHLPPCSVPLYAGRVRIYNLIHQMMFFSHVSFHGFHRHWLLIFFCCRSIISGSDTHIPQRQTDSLSNMQIPLTPSNFDRRERDWKGGMPLGK